MSISRVYCSFDCYPHTRSVKYEGCKYQTVTHVHHFTLYILSTQMHTRNTPGACSKSSVDSGATHLIPLEVCTCILYECISNILPRASKDHAVLLHICITTKLHEKEKMTCWHTDELGKKVGNKRKLKLQDIQD